MMDYLESISHPLEADNDLDPLMEQINGASAVLIGGATHGTSDFYRWRAKITQRLIKEKGFSFVAVEGSWPNCFQVSRLVKNPPDSERTAHQILNSLNRWPTWLWANSEVLDFIEWLAAYNKNLPMERRVGFYGLDIYSLWESLNVAVDYIKDTVPDSADAAAQIYKCFESYRRDFENYPFDTGKIPEFCKERLIKLLSTLEHLPPVASVGDAEDRLNVEQSALTAVNAERFYSIMLQGSADSWNLREEHMAHTFFRLLNFYGKISKPKGIIWTHNVHAGDARATEMVDRDEFSIGQIVRDALSAGDTFLIGFGTYQGSVAAADDWNEPVKEMVLPPAIHDSWEGIFHDLNQANRMILFSQDKARAEQSSQRMGHRSIGVVHDPRAEFANYMQAVLSEQYDAFLFIDKTAALHPLNIEPKLGEPPGTFPMAV